MRSWKTITTYVIATLTFLNASAYGADSINLTPDDSKALIELLHSCDVSLQSCQRASQDKDAVIAAQQRTLEAQAAQVAEYRAADSAILNSKVLWFAIGMLTAGLTVYLVKQPAQ